MRCELWIGFAVTLPASRERVDGCSCRVQPVQHFPHADAGHDFAALLEQPTPTHSIADRSTLYLLAGVTVLVLA